MNETFEEWQNKKCTELSNEYRKPKYTHVPSYTLGQLQEDILNSYAVEMAWNHQQAKIDKLQAELDKYKNACKKRNDIIQNIYDICLCERFKTEGFDYHEKHPRRKENNRGSRPFTPRDLIENEIGFKWEEPNGVFSAFKKLKLNEDIDGFEGTPTNHQKTEE